MAFYGKEYKLQTEEKFDEFLKAVGVPDDKIQILLAFKPGQKVEKNGDSYSITTTTPKGNRVVTFKSGEEFDDTIGEETTPSKNIYTVDGNTITQLVKTDRGSATFKREFNGDELVVTITSDNWDGIARRYYKA